jgi:hypothetical protein
MNAKRIHPTLYHRHNGAFRAETARYEGFVTKGALFGVRRRLLQKKSGCKTTLGRYG